MVDQMVQQAQVWLNRTYEAVNGYTRIAEDGVTGFTTIYALVKGLQHELGDSPVDGVFGDTTLAKLSSRFPVVSESTANSNMRRIVQCALYCKGYDGGGIDGNFGDRTLSGISRLVEDMGLGRDTKLVPKVIRALLTMDAYVVTSGGTQKIREAQQWLNRTYIARAKFMIAPCDGHFSRGVQRSLVRALQFELGQNDSQADGIYGTGTANAIKAKAVVSIGSEDSEHKFVSLFQAALIFNGVDVQMDGKFTTTTRNAVSSFQKFMILPENGKGDFQTWAALLVSTGDPDRQGTGLDTRFPLSDERAKLFYEAGYRTVGRYLTNATGGSALDKKIQSGELALIFNAGLRIFPIYQTYGGSAKYFTRQQGLEDGRSAHDSAQSYGFKRNTTIYFAVDFDAIDEEISGNVLGYFRGVISALLQSGGFYTAGVYGSRNVCIRVSGEVGISRSFVSGMSTGFSGNLGYPMPKNWAFNQIKEYQLSSSDANSRIDKLIVSGRDAGQSSVSESTAREGYFDSSETVALARELTSWFEVNMTTAQKAASTNPSITANVDYMLKFDKQITRLSRSFHMNKAFIQSVFLWEYTLQNLGDVAADQAVRVYYDAKLSGKSPVPGSPSDSSTGLCQIFSRTAIAATDFVAEKGLYGGRKFDSSDWKDVWQMWSDLQDEETNLTMAALVIVHAASQVGLEGKYWLPSISSVRKILGRYNGTNSDATEYGRRNSGLYSILDRYNSLTRR